MRREIITLMLLLLGCWVSCFAQPDAPFNHYWATPTLYNPAATGLSNNLNITGGGRLRWEGIENVPRNLLLTADLPVSLFERRHGIGIVVSDERDSLSSSLRVSVQYAFQIKLGEGILQIGLQPGFATVGHKEEANSSLPTTNMKGNTLTLGAGIYYRLKMWSMGISASHLTGSVVQFSENSSTTIPRQIYFTTGGNISVESSLLTIAPSVLVHSDFQAVRAEATVRAIYNKRFWLGGGYRYNNGVIGLMGVTIKGVGIGYSYDCSPSPEANIGNGSHELFICYQLKLNTAKRQNYKYKSIRIL